MSHYIKVLSFLLLALFVADCSNSRDLASKDTNRSFKDGAKSISYHYTGSSSSLYGQIYQSLLKHGFHISLENKEKGIIKTGGKAIGQNTKMKLHINLEQINDDSVVAHFRSEWAADQDDPVIITLMSGKDYEIHYQPATWGENEHPDLAYSFMYQFVRKLDPNNKYALRHHTD